MDSSLPGARFDKIGIGASLFCAVHCIAMPLLFTALPIMGVNLLHNIILEISTLLMSLAIGGYAIWNGYRKMHRKTLPVFFYFIGISMLITGNLAGNPSFEIIAKIIGVLLLVACHISNMAFSKNHSASCCKN